MYLFLFFNISLYHIYLLISPLFALENKAIKQNWLETEDEW